MSSKVVRRRRAGFTLIDAMVACMLLTGGLVVVTGAMQGLALTHDATGAKVRAQALASSVLTELKGLPFEDVFQYDPDDETLGDVRVEVLDARGQTVTLPTPGLHATMFPALIEARITARCKTTRGHVITVRTVGFLAERGVQP